MEKDDENMTFPDFYSLNGPINLDTAGVVFYKFKKTGDKEVQAMRSIDQLKIDRIHKAAMDIVYQDGFDHISLRHIAKMAKVSPGAP